MSTDDPEGSDWKALQKRLLAALARSPELLLAVKDLMLDVRVAGPWVDFNTSEYSKLRNISFPKGTLVRFTPGRWNNAKTEPIIKVRKRHKPVLSNRHQLDEDHEWEEQVRDHEAEVEDWKINPYGWRIEMLFHKMFPMAGREGFAADQQQAQDKADAVLQAAGWVLVGL